MLAFYWQLVQSLLVSKWHILNPETTMRIPEYFEMAHRPHSVFSMVEVNELPGLYEILLPVMHK